MTFCAGNTFFKLKICDMKNDNRNDETRNNDQDQLRDNTMNEVIRETSGDADTNLNDLRDTDDMDDNSRISASASGDTDTTQGMSYNPNDTSAVRSGGTTDMDDQTAGGAGLNTGARDGLGSHLRPKENVTGSDFDGQNRTS